MQATQVHRLQVVSPQTLAELRNVNPSETLSSELYGAIARIVPSVAIEAVALRTRNGREEVYLTRRSKDDAAYPNMLHCPGSLLRSGETPHHTMQLLALREFKAPIHSFEYIDEIYFMEERGWFNCRAHRVILGAEPTVGIWYPVDDLPADVVQHHIDDIIPMVVRDFRLRQLV